LGLSHIRANDIEQSDAEKNTIALMAGRGAKDRE
jgi:hypothetical protein